MRYPLALILFLLYHYGTKGQSVYEPIGASIIATANTSATLFGLWSGFQNPAGISEVESTEFGINFQNSFQIPELNAGSVGIILPTRKLNTFIGAHKLGNKVYSEHRVALAASSKVGISSLGVRVNYLQTQILDFSSSYDYSIDLGIISQFSSIFLIGASIYNISNYQIEGEEISKVPTIILIGVKYRPLNYLDFNFEVEKDLRFPAFIKSSIQYNMRSKWCFSTGVRSDIWQTFYGIGLYGKKISLDYALSIHTVLGSSHSLSLSYKKLGK